MTHFYEVPRDRKEKGGFQGLQEGGGVTDSWGHSFRLGRWKRSVDGGDGCITL